MATTPTRRRKPAPEPETVEVEETIEAEDEFEGDELEDVADDDLEELEDEPEETPAPKRTAKKTPAADGEDKPKRKPPVQPTIEFGSPWLAAHVTEVTGETYDARGIRMLLRKLAKDGLLERVVGEDRGRYEFSGPQDSTVKAVVAMVKSGAAKALKQEGLQKVKDAAEAKKAAKKAAAEAEVVEDEDDMDEVEEDEAPAPKPRTARKPTPAKAAAPAKATPATARRRPATAVK